MAYNVRKNWAESFNLILSKPSVLLPFCIVAFVEGLALELIYFSCRRPLAAIAAPIVRKFFGENFLHYPANLALLPKLFYYAQIVIYVLSGVLLSAIAVGMVKNIRQGLPLKARALLKNALQHYASFFLFGALVSVLVFLVRKLDLFTVGKLVNLAGGHLPGTLLNLVPYLLTLSVFLTSIILQTFLILAVPVIVVKRRLLFRALGESIMLGLRHFRSIFALIFLPFLVYLPVLLLKTAAPLLMDKAFPEINLYITALGIIVTVFAEGFIFVCVTQFLLDKSE